MFYNENVAGIYPEFLRVLHGEIGSFEFDERFPGRNVPTHTEDGIPIRKLYVTNLPPKVTRTELFGVFTQYGYVKSCWLRMGEKGPNRIPSPTYAFVTFNNPSDAYRALLAPSHEKMLSGRMLRISPADSWHQPMEDSSGRVIWRSNIPPHDKYENQQTPEVATSSESKAEVAPEKTESDAKDNEASSTLNEKPLEESSQEETDGRYNLLDVLNRDCMFHIMSYIPLGDLIRSERVSKDWQNMVMEYYECIRLYKTVWWPHEGVTLTTAILRRVLQRLNSLTRLHIDHHWSALNDRTAHTIGKFCPMLEELKIVSMNTQNWNPLFYGCKQLKSVSFHSCHKVTDSNLMHLVKSDSCIESITVANNSHVTGLFLTGARPPQMHALAFHNCYSLQGSVLCAAADTMSNLMTLKLDTCPMSLWKIVPDILKKLPKLQELSLSGYTSLIDGMLTPPNDFELCDSLEALTEMRVINFSRNVYITNAVLKQVAKCCPKLISLNVAACNARKCFGQRGVGDEGLLAVFRSCSELRWLDASYLAGLTDAGVAGIAGLYHLAMIRIRGNRVLSAQPFNTCLQTCRSLKELDICGCDGVSDSIIDEAVKEVKLRPRKLLLRIGGTLAAHSYYNIEMVHETEALSGGMLNLNLDDLCSTPLRPDFVDEIFDDGSDYSLDFDELLGSDEELFDDDYDLEEYEQEHLLHENIMFRFDLEVPPQDYLSI